MIRQRSRLRLVRVVSCACMPPGEGDFKLLPLLTPPNASLAVPVCRICDVAQDLHDLAFSLPRKA